MNWIGVLGVVRLPVIAGPTGAGKSALALRFAETAPVAIISADSRQIYRGFDVGTGKPSAADRAAVTHALIDVADPTERFTAARWASEAEAAILAALDAGQVPLLVGGTGLYLRALFEPLFEEPPLDPLERAALADQLAAHSTSDLRRQVERLDPPRAHLGRTQLLRAVEVAVLTGTPITAWYERAPRRPRFAPSYLIVERGAALAHRMASRVDAMLAAGWLDEVRALAPIVPHGAPAWNATGYESIRQVVLGRLDLERARQQVVIRTRQFAKRQRTWLRHQLDPDAVTTVDLEESGGTDRALDWWRTREAM
ncbi:MAG: tRNA (adenosine(37)-N6)-dimethylallyltransferase MiaA [Gemmatimonadaceae bacterium]